MDTLTRREVAITAAVAAATAVAVALHPDKAIDYRVYFDNARHFFGAGAAMYGPQSGTGWAGGVYRYPPIFLDLFRPLAALPLAAGAALWAAGKILVLGWLLICLRRRWQLPTCAHFWPALLLVAAYFIQDLRYGNAQFYIVALVMLAGIAASDAWGGAWLGWAAALKVWPLFFFPCLELRRQGRRLAAALASFAAWTLLPVLWRGWTGQARLLGQWLAQERAIAATSAAAGELWYPGQSLHDVMARYLSVIDYARLPDAGYPQVAWLHLQPAVVERLWWVAAALVLLALAVCLWRTVNEDAAVAMMFCGVVVLEPHVHRLILETLAWPALWLAAELFHRRLLGWRRLGLAVAVAAAVLEPLVPGASRQRWLQAHGSDFFLVVFPLALAVASQALLRRNADGQTPLAATH